MRITDYISIGALVIALMSLYISARSSAFSKRTKLAELRATLLAKISEASLSNARLHRLHLELRELESVNAGSEEPRLFAFSEIEQNQCDLDKLYKLAAASPIRKAGETYELAYHELNHLCGRIDAMESRFVALKQKYVKVLSKTKV